MVCQESRVHYFVDSLLFVVYHEVRSFSWDKAVCLYPKIPEIFVLLILHDGFWVVHISLIRMVKFKFLLQFSVDHLPNPVLSSLTHFIIIYSFRFFHISVSWWSFTGVWVTASLIKSPGPFSVFRLSSILLLYGWSPLVRQLHSPSGPLIIL